VPVPKWLAADGLLAQFASRRSDARKRYRRFVSEALDMGSLRSGLRQQIHLGRRAALQPHGQEDPRDFIETGISSIDMMNSLVREQKLPIFSAGGLPHNRMALDIATNTRLRDRASSELSIVFVGIDIPHDSAESFRKGLEETGALERTVLFLNRASESSVQRLLTPRFALTAAEYLAFQEGRHVLIILTDLTNYCEARRNR
jgi:V/A-type H+-transporting ATPase subunit B